MLYMEQVPKCGRLRCFSNVFFTESIRVKKNVGIYLIVELFKSLANIKIASIELKQFLYLQRYEQFLASTSRWEEIVLNVEQVPKRGRLRCFSNVFFTESIRVKKNVGSYLIVELFESLANIKTHLIQLK